ncbi:MAG: hypothetical protein E7K67_04415 [Peptostreptococcaceae bacterium]|nr:hypothetical protein [Peptostreptococcaceae bacterium]
MKGLRNLSEFLAAIVGGVFALIGTFLGIKYISYVKIDDKIIFYRYALYKWIESTKVNVTKN